MTFRVVVTGYGGVCSLGDNANEIWHAIENYQAGYSYYRFPNETIHARFFGFMQPDRARYAGIPKALLKMLPDFGKNAVIAAREALAMAFGQDVRPTDHVDPFDIGVIIGTGWGGTDSIHDNNEDFRQTGLSTSFATLMSMPSIATGAVSLHWNLRGYQNTPVAACATGTAAIGDAYEIIRNGRQKVMLAGGSESIKRQVNVWAIDVIQALTKATDDVTRACCPFDRERSGFVLSEGAAILCLEEREHALARGATILGEITGYANFSDAFDMTAPAEDCQARIRAIGSVLDQSGIAPEAIDYINLHGTSTPFNDLNETRSLKEALGQVAYDIPMSSTKSYTGHLIAAAGAMEAIFCLKALETGTVPATIHLDKPDPECDLDYTPKIHRHGQDIRSAINLSFGFGGANCALMLQRICP
jgi:3-oxoacyl-[acyl-carrier-protein] synthase II